MSNLLIFDQATFREKFPNQPFVIKHNLVGHKLFELSRLLELSKKLPANMVEYNAGNLEVNQDPDKTPRTGLSIEETIRRIEEAKSWMVLKYVETDPEYRQLLHDVLAEARVYADSITPGACQYESFIFITSPGSVTPYHMDPEHNFLLQIKGNKTVHMWDQNDRTILTEPQLESFYVGGIHRNMEYKDEFTKKQMVFNLKPGDGLHFPITAPHWVKVEGEYSISWSVTFRSTWSERRSNIFRMNADLRKMGLNPSPVGISGFKDNTKDTVFRLQRRLKNMLGMKERHTEHKY